MILSAPVSAFSRRQFVRSVLGQIAAHYNLAANDLVLYFYRALADRKTGFSQGVAEVLKEWLDEQRRNERLESEKEREAASRDTGRKLKELMMCPEVTVKVLEKQEQKSFANCGQCISKRIRSYLSGIIKNYCGIL